jgi:hypothetical protein
MVRRDLLRKEWPFERALSWRLMHSKFLHYQKGLFFDLYRVQDQVVGFIRVRSKKRDRSGGEMVLNSPKNRSGKRGCFPRRELVLHKTDEKGSEPSSVAQRGVLGRSFSPLFLGGEED